jgi:hypothetical protein
MKAYITIPSRRPTCLVEHVMVMLFHDIAAIFLTFVILNWIFNFIWFRILGSRQIRRWSRRLRRLRRRPVSKLGIVCARVGLVSISILEGLVYVLARAQDVLRILAFYIARGNLIVIDFCISFDRVDIEGEGAEDVKETKKKEVKGEARHSSAFVEAAVKSTAKPSLKVTFESPSKPAVKSGFKTRSRAAEIHLKTSLEDNPDRNWSNEHGNLSPGSSPTAHSTSSTHTVRPTRIADPTRPLRCERPNSSRMKHLTGPSPSGLSSPSSASAAYKPDCSETTFSDLKFDHTAYEEYSRTRASLEFRRAVFAASVSSAGGRAVRTPSTSPSSDGDVNTPSTSSSSGGVHTPSSTCIPESGSSSSRGVLTSMSTSSSESEVMAIHTPPSTDSPGSEDSSRSGTPDSVSPSDSDETVIRTPSP